MDDLARRRYERIVAFGRDWDRRDVDALMTHITDDCVFIASVGPEPGATFGGREAVRAGFEQLLSYDAHATSESDGAYLAGARAVATWIHRVEDRRGKSIVTRGCDLFTFRDDKICRKDAFRKVFA